MNGPASPRGPLGQWIRQWFARRRARAAEARREEEFAFHLDMERRRLMAAGMTRSEAGREADRRFGDLDRLRRQCNTEQTGQPEPSASFTRWRPDMLTHDFKYALRTLARQPGFTVVVGTTLALGIGATTAVFSVVNSVLLTPLPYHEPERLVRMYAAWENNPDARSVMSGLDFIDYRESAEGFEALAVLYTYSESGLDLMGQSGPVRIRALPISAEYFAVYRATPLMGRTFERAEERSDAGVAILSHRLWREQMEGDPTIVGQRITLSGEPYTVIGVMRPTFSDVIAGEVDIWIPQDLQPGGYNSRGNHYLTAIGRLAPGVTVTQAQTQIDIVTQRQQQEFPDSNKFARIYSMFDEVVGRSHAMLLVLMGAAGLVLLIACVNVANLYLARGVARQREMAIRTALGSGAHRLIGQLVTESLVLASVAGAAGLVIAYWGVRALLALSPQSLARAEEVGFDLRLLGFAAAVTVATGALFALAPMVQVRRLNLNSNLREGARGSTMGSVGRRLRGVLVAGQIALALMLLVGAGLLTKSFVALQQTPLGIQAPSTATFEVHLPDARYANPATRIRFHQDLHTRLRRAPGITAVGATSWLPANGKYHSWGYGFHTPEGERSGASIQVRIIQGDYFDAMGIVLVRGRHFTDADRDGAPPVAILNESAARTAFGDRDPIGRTVGLGGERTVVGVVEDVAHDHQGTTDRKLYFPHAQYGDDRNWALIHTVQTARADIYDLARRELQAIDPELVLYQPRSMNEVLGHRIAQDRFGLILMSLFAAIALSLATIGIYGVLSYIVSQRTQEIGIRIALGARTSQVRNAVMRQGAWLTAGGVGVGVVAAVGVSRLLDTLVFGISVRDPIIFATVAVGLTVVAALAGYVPARRATRVSPMEAMRDE